MAVPVLLNTVKLQNIFSFVKTTVELRALNVLIGPNGVGKSNFIEVMGLLHAAPIDLPSALQQLGGAHEVFSLREELPLAQIRCGFESGLEYRLDMQESGSSFLILFEGLDDCPSGVGKRYFERNRQGMSMGGPRSDIAATHSVFSAYKVPGDPTPITALGGLLSRVRIYRDFRTSGPYSPARSGVSSSATKDFLHDGGDNLALVLHELDFKGVHAQILPYLTRFCERFQDVKTRLRGPVMGTYMQESGLLEPLSAMRLSDGTLKFLCLLAILLNPDPPPLICIEEPEVGLHPDAIRIVADALIDAAQRTQLIVTTHSEALIDAFSDRPEDVLVCERDFDNGTQFRRLDRNQLSEWLEHYTLGALWRKGELGGNRW